MKGLAKVADTVDGIPMALTVREMTCMLTAAADIVLALDDGGVIRDVRLGQMDHPIEESNGWLGLEWAETVSPESRAKIIDMLKEAVTEGVSRRRQVNHLSAYGNDIPIAYTALRIEGRKHSLVAVGRDLRAVSALQQRMVEAQQTLERDYWRMRHIETRYRLLLQLSTEAVLIVDATTLKVVEANPAAAQLFDQPVKKLVGRSFPLDLDRQSESAVFDQLVAVRAHGHADDLVVRLAGSAQRVTIAASLVRQDATALFVIRILPVAEWGAAARVTAPDAVALKLVEALPDGFVVTDGEGRVLSANRAFLDLVQIPTESQVRGQSLQQWIGRPGADLGLIFAALREHGIVRLFGTTLRGELGSPSEVEVSCAAVPEGSQERVGFLVRDVGRRLELDAHGARDLTRAVEQLTALVGRVSLRNLVRDTTDLVERHFIEAALELTHDNRTSAAEVLGVSRQSLYVKLRRYNLGRAGVEVSAEAAPRKTAKPKPRRVKKR
ncbi:MAG: transcriptional regulator PpsR [Gemmatimonadota bacterium]